MEESPMVLQLPLVDKAIIFLNADVIDWLVLMIAALLAMIGLAIHVGEGFLPPPSRKAFVFMGVAVAILLIRMLMT